MSDNEGPVQAKPDQERPADAPADKPAPKPAAQTPAQPEKPADKPAAKPADKPAPKPAAQTPAQPEKPADKPAAKPAAQKPAPKQAEPPAFEKGLSDRIVESLGERVQVRFVKPDRIGIQVKRDDIVEVAQYLRDNMGLDHAESVCGVDYPADKEIEVVYHLASYTDDSMARQVLELATRAPREDSPNPGSDSTTLPSLRDVFYSVEFHERECFEMLGVYFEGHPDNRRLLLPEDWADLPPLRRDFAIKGR